MLPVRVRYRRRVIFARHLRRFDRLAPCATASTMQCPRYCLAASISEILKENRWVSTENIRKQWTAHRVLLAVPVGTFLADARTGSVALGFPYFLPIKSMSCYSEIDALYYTVIHTKFSRGRKPYLNERWLGVLPSVAFGLELPHWESSSPSDFIPVSFRSWFIRSCIASVIIT